LQQQVLLGFDAGTNHDAKRMIGMWHTPLFCILLAMPVKNDC
jgi:hypothetical protein